MLNPLIPIRLVLTNQCNGKCSFCHVEGNFTQKEMELDTIKKVKLYCERNGIKKITLTGGEPSLYKKFEYLIRDNLNKNTFSGNIGITTNGKIFDDYDNSFIDEYFDFISISIPTLSDKWKLFTDVNPYQIVDQIKKIRIKKTVNVVVSNWNISELSKIIEFTKNMGCTLDLMINLQGHFEHMQNHLIQFFGSNNILIRSSSHQFFGETIINHVNIRLKLPLYSMMQEFPICSRCECKESCGERICSIRVYPDNSVSGCLNNRFLFNKFSDVTFNLQEAYKDIFV